MNKVIVTGRLTKDVEIKKTKNDKSYVSFSLGVDNGYGDNKKTIFPNFTAWDKTADFIGKYFHKGDQLIIEGFLNENEYEKDGNKVKSSYIQVTNVEFGATKSEPKSEPKSELKPKVEIEPDELPFY